MGLSTFESFRKEKTTPVLALFRSNQLFLSILLIFYVAGLHMASFVFPTAISNSSPGILGGWLIEWINHNKIVADIITILLLFVQGVLINVMVSRHRLTPEVNLFPGVFYVLIASFIPDFLQLSPLLLANTFYIIVLMELMASYKQPFAADRIFNAGFWTAVASFFYFSYLIFLVLVLISLSILRVFNIKETIIFLIGAIIPHFLLGVYYFWYDQLPFFWERHFMANIDFFDFDWPSNMLIYIKLSFFALLLLVVLLSFGSYSYKRVIQVKKKISILFWGLFIAFFTLLFQSGVHIDHLLIIAVPLGILLSINFSKMPAQMAEIIHLVLVSTALFLQFYPYLLGT